MSKTSASLAPELASALITELPCGLVTINNDELISWANPAFTSMLAITAEELIGITLAELHTSYLSPIDGSEDKLQVKHNDGRCLQCFELPLEVNHDQLKYALAYIDISAQVALAKDRDKLVEQLDDLSTVDPVSSLLNQKAMMQTLEPLVSRSRRYKNPLSIIAMEILNLEAIRSQHGLAATDQAIVALSHLLKDQMRWADIISRVTDSKFILILPETEESDARLLSTKLANHIANLVTDVEGNEAIRLEMKSGVAAWEQGSDSILLLRSANKYLQQAKDNSAGQITG